jgi:hypothetical protein
MQANGYLDAHAHDGGWLWWDMCDRLVPPHVYNLDVCLKNGVFSSIPLVMCLGSHGGLVVHQAAKHP